MFWRDRHVLLGMMAWLVLPGAPGLTADRLPPVVLGDLASSHSVTGGGPSLAPSLSADGRVVAFLSTANNLVANDDIGASIDIFARELATGTNRLVSVDHSGRGGGNDHSAVPALSGDGRFIAFESTASNLVLEDTNRFPDVFVRDLQTEKTHLISVPNAGLVMANGPSRSPAISGDGRWVFFASAASNLVQNVSQGGWEIYARDQLAALTILVSADTTAAGTGPGPASDLIITPDARFAAFTKRAVQPVGSLTSFGEVYVRDLQSSTTIWASSNLTTYITSSNYTCVASALSSNGQSLLLKLFQNEAEPAQLIWRDLQTGRTERPEQAILGDASLSADGILVAYATTNGIYLWDAANRNARLICPNATVPNQSVCTWPALAATASRVAFVCTSNDLPAIAVYDWIAQTSWWASRTTNDLPAVASETAAPIISTDGKLVLFESLDSRIVAGDANRTSDIFAADESEIGLVSERHLERPAQTTASASRWLYRSVSAGSTHAAYLTFAEEDTTPATNQFVQLRVQDLKNGTTSTLGPLANPPLDVALSADGRFLAFSTGVPRHLGLSNDELYWRDLTRPTNTLVTTLLEQSTFSTDKAVPFALSSDGQQLAFVRASSIYIRDLRTDQVELVSLTPGGITGGLYPVFSPDDRWLVFTWSTNTYARDLVAKRTLRLGASNGSNPPQIAFSADSRVVAAQVLFGSGSRRIDLFVLFGLVPQDNLSVCTNCDSPSVSTDGRYVAYRSTSSGHVYVRDMHNNRLELVSIGFNGQTNFGLRADFRHPQISHDGRYVVFASTARGLVANDTNFASDVFVHDRLRTNTSLVSLALDGHSSARGSSSSPVLAADGRTILFYSDASDLVEGDYNEAGDVYVARLSGPDTDGDSLDDTWELAYFNSLDRDGSGDFDGDGNSDKAEFVAGTDPTDSRSILPALTIARLAGSGTRIVWNASPGRTYLVQYRDTLDQTDWVTASAVIASGSTGSWLDPAKASQSRYYRIAIVPE